MCLSWPPKAQRAFERIILDYHCGHKWNLVKDVDCKASAGKASMQIIPWELREAENRFLGSDKGIVRWLERIRFTERNWKVFVV